MDIIRRSNRRLSGFILKSTFEIGILEMFENFQIDTVSIDAPVSFGGGGEGTEGLGHTIGAAIGSVVGGAVGGFFGSVPGAEVGGVVGNSVGGIIGGAIEDTVA
ncbi:hypothetical protein [Nitratireductor aquibiodomus]|nr:hypothetical protein [Nitratireductor aquibiodomus]